MKYRNLISYLLIGVFLINLMSAHSNGPLQILTGNNVSVVHPFCKKVKSKKADTKSAKIDFANEKSVEIPALCINVFKIDNPSLTFIFTEDNFKTYTFSNKFHLNLYAEQFYIPPRV